VELIRSDLFINRELSWLAFNERVLEESRDAGLPLLERLKFTAIFSSNLDEFFMVRVAGLRQQRTGGVNEGAADGTPPSEQLDKISERVHQLIAVQYQGWTEALKPGLGAAGLSLLNWEELSPEQRSAARQHFLSNVFPALTPLAVDPGHPFPHLRNKSLNVALRLRREGKGKKKHAAGTTTLAVVQVPTVLPRLVSVPSSSGLAFVLLEALIAAHAAELFPGFGVTESAPFRVTRNWDLALDDEESEDLLASVQQELRRRDRGAAVRLELDARCSVDVETDLREALSLEPQDVYRCQGPLQLNDLLALGDVAPRPELKVEPFTPSIPAAFAEADSIFDVIREKDMLLHHPYDSFETVTRLIEEAAEDPNVLAIKQTLYRAGGGDSKIVRALGRAAENGKQVAVLVEIKARFDEATNIAWARSLEESGVHVVYGLIGLKTHCKVALVVRREQNGIKRYVHLSTGNYNAQTAKQYTDVCLFTARKEFAEDVTALFNMLTGNSAAPQWKRLSVAPIDLRDRVMALIDREAEKAKKGQPARIIAKLNALVDPEVIRALYRASQAGVEIDLLVRGICCLRPGVPGVSERIRVMSVVDRFLEHSRIFAFGTGDQAEVYISSADWMPRNFVKRVEVMFPVEDPALKARLLNEILASALRDTVKARRLQPDGSYVRVESTEAGVRSQYLMLEIAKGTAEPPRNDPAIRFAAGGR
jgi:polyphosphate kinase